MYDLIIIGAGPAGLTASIYASCFKLNHLVIGKITGGQLLMAPDILNYPGFDEINGKVLTDKMLNQVKKRGGEVVNEHVNKIEKIEYGYKLITDSQKTFETRTIILATGVERRKLNIPGETEYTAKGIEYCATCGKHDYENKTAAIVGGANAAAQTAVQVAHSATKVYIIYRGTNLRCDPIWMSQIEKNPKIELLYNAQVKKVKGNGSVVSSVMVEVKDPATKAVQNKEITLDKVFIEIGGVPGTALLIPIGVRMDPGGFIDVDENLSTNIPGVYVAGDVISHKYSIEQITSAVGTGARAATNVFTFIKQQKAPTLWGASQIKR